MTSISPYRCPECLRMRSRKILEACHMCRPSEHDRQLGRLHGLTRRAINRLGGAAKLETMGKEARDLMLSLAKRSKK